MTITPTVLAGLIDHTLLAASATKEQFEQLCREAIEYGFAMVAINPYPVELCAKLLDGTGVRVGAAIGFPLGQTTIEDKVSETARAIERGAGEIDYVINITELTARNTAYIEDEMAQIVAACRSHGVLSKVIFENCYLSDDEKRTAAQVAAKVGPDFVKTSTGFGTGGATLPDVDLMREAVAGTVQIKAAGGVRTLDDALTFLDHGVTRIGTSSGIALVEELRQRG